MLNQKPMRRRFLSLSAALVTACASTENVREAPYAGDAWSAQRPPHGIPSSALAIVSNSRSDDLSLIDLTKNEVVTTVPIDVDPIGLDAPHHLAMSPRGDFLYVPLSYPPPTAALGPHGQHGASALPGLVVKLRASDLSRVAITTVDQNPGDIVLTPDGSRALVSHFDLKKAIDGITKGRPLAELRAALIVLDTATLKRLASPSPCVAAHGLVVTRDGTRAYAACYGEDAIAMIALDSPSYASELWPLGSALAIPPNVSLGPYFVSLTPAQDAIVVSQTERKELRVVDVATRKTMAVVDTRGAAFGPASSADGALWIVPTQGPDTLLAVDGKTWSVTATRNLTTTECDKPHQVARKGDRWFVVCEGDWKTSSTVLELDPATLATRRTFKVGAYPDMILFGTEAP